MAIFHENPGMPVPKCLHFGVYGWWWWHLEL